MDLRKRISQATEKAIQERVFPGCVIGIVDLNGKRQIFPFGNFTYNQLSPKAKEDSIYDVASITKSIPTASLALQLIDEGKLELTSKLIDFVPEFRNSDRENVLIKHLLTYTVSGYGIITSFLNGATKTLQEISASELRNFLLSNNFDNRPGTTYQYASPPAFLLGLVVEKIMNSTLDCIASKYFFNPLNMNRTTFHPENFPLEEIVPAETNEWRGLVRGVVHDESAYVFIREGIVTGHAGLFSTVPDILNFLEMLLNKGAYQGRRYFSERTIEAMSTNQIPELGESIGLGWELNQPQFMGKYCTPNTFGKTGFTGTLCVGDIPKGIAYVVLSNHVFPKRPQDRNMINTFRKTIGEIILEP